MDETAVRAMIKDHFDWASKDEVRASLIYADDAVLEFPQSGERIRGKANIIAFRTAYPAAVTFDMHRTIGAGDLWVNEYTIRYDGARPHMVVGIMEFRDGKVVRERLYINEPWQPPAWRARWVELMTDETRVRGHRAASGLPAAHLLHREIPGRALPTVWYVAPRRRPAHLRTGCSGRQKGAGI